MLKLLNGKKEIRAQTGGRSWKTIRRWIREEGFPAKKIDGRWQSDPVMIRKWFGERLPGQ